MKPIVTNVTEQNILGANGQISKGIVLTYKVGMFGPFTLITNQTDVQSGAAMTQMQQFATSLAQLPTA